MSTDHETTARPSPAVEEVRDARRSRRTVVVVVAVVVAIVVVVAVVAGVVVTSRADQAAYDREVCKVYGSMSDAAKELNGC